MTEIRPGNRLWQPPRLRTLEADGQERHATWLELFYDLIFVAAIAQLGKSHGSEATITGIFKLVLLYIPVWWAWVGTAFYATRFDSDSMTQRIFYLLEIIGVAALAMFIPDGTGFTSTGFALSYAFIRLILVVQYLLASYHNPEARTLTNRYAIGFGIASFIWILSTFFDPPVRFTLWILAFIFDIGAPVSAGKMHLKVPPNTAHISERYGLFTIVVLGETVMAAVTGVSGQQTWHVLSAVSSVCGLVTAFCIWWAYFDNLNQTPVKPDADASVRVYQTWLYTHLPLTLALTAMGGSIQHIILSLPTEPLPFLDKWLFHVSTAVALVSLGVIHSTSCYFGTHLNRQVWLPYFCGALVMILSAIMPVLPVASCSIALLACILVVGFNLYRDRRIYNETCTLQ